MEQLNRIIGNPISRLLKILFTPPRSLAIAMVERDLQLYALACTSFSGTYHSHLEMTVWIYYFKIIQH